MIKNIGISKKNIILAGLMFFNSFLLTTGFAQIPEKTPESQNAELSTKIFENNPVLTQEEMDFLKNNPKIKISNRVDWIPYDFAIAGRPAGFGVELMKLLFDKLNVEPEFVTVNSWNEILNMFYNNEIHIVHSLAKTEERQAKALFSKPYYFSRNVLIQRNSDRIVRDFDDLKGKIIALPRGWASVSFMREKYPDIYILEVPNNAIAFEYVEKGKAFATLEQKAIADYLIKKFGFTDLIYSNGITDVELQSISSLHFAVLKKNMILMSILEKAFASINPEEISKIEKKWFGSGKSVEFLESIFLTREEDNYLEYRP